MTRYYYDGHKIVETRVGDNPTTYHQQFIHGTQYIDELVMIRVKDKGDLYVHQDANWNVIGLTDLGGHLVERYVLAPYGELTVYQETSYGDRDGDGDVDATDKGTPGSTCTGTVSGECRILDLDFDGDYDSTDAGLFDSLPHGLARHPGRIATAVDQPFGHQGLLYEPELAQYQNRARQYDPAKRRFIQTDKFAFRPYRFWTVRHYRDGMNLYGYVGGNPAKRRDPSGLCAQGATVDIIVGSAAGCPPGQFKYRHECRYCPCDWWITYSTSPKWTCCGDPPSDAKPCSNPTPPPPMGVKCCAWLKNRTYENCKDCCWESVDDLPDWMQKEMAEACELQRVCENYP